MDSGLAIEAMQLCSCAEFRGFFVMHARVERAQRQALLPQFTGRAAKRSRPVKGQDVTLRHIAGAFAVKESLAIGTFRGGCAIVPLQLREGALTRMAER